MKTRTTLIGRITSTSNPLIIKNPPRRQVDHSARGLRRTPPPAIAGSSAVTDDEPLYMSVAGILVLLALFLLVWSSTP